MDIMKNSNNFIRSEYAYRWPDSIIPGIAFLILYVSSTVLSPLNVPDEGRYASIAFAMLQNKDYISPMLNGVLFMDKPVMYYWLEAVSMHFLGINELSIRLPMAVIGVFGLLQTQYTATVFYGRRAGWLAAIILGSSLLYCVSSNYADMNLEVAIWISSSLLFALLGLHHPSGNKRRLLFYAAYMFAAFAMLTKGLMGFFFPAMVLGLYSLLTRRWRLIREIYLPGGLVIFIILCAPWYIAMQQKHPEFFHYFFIYQQITRFIDTGFNSDGPIWFYLPIIFVGMIPWSFFIPKALGFSFQFPWKDTPALYFGIWAASIFIFFSIPDSKPVTYIMPVFPPLAILIARQMDEWMKAKASCMLGYPGALIAGTAGIICLVLSQKQYMPFISSSTEPGVHAWLITSGIMLIVTFILAVILTVRRSHAGLIVLTVVCLLSTFICLHVLSGKLNVMSTKSLALSIKNKITPDTRIINYRQYYYDLPLYLKDARPIIVVDDWTNHEKIMAGDNWRRELFLGMRHTARSCNWIIQPDEMSRILKKHPSYIFVRASESKFLEQQYQLTEIARKAKVVLMTNTKPSF